LNQRFSLFEVILLAGVTQGLVTAVLIWTSKNRSTAKLILSLVLTVFNLLCLKILIHTTGLWQTQWLRYVPLPLELAIQPLLWLYVTSLTTPGFRLRKKYLIHFIPFALSLVYSLYVYLAAAGTSDLAAKDTIANALSFNPVKEMEDYLSIASSILYWFLGFRLVIRYRHWLYHTTSDTDFPTYAWLRNVMVLLGVLIAGLTTAILLDSVFQFGALHFIHWQLFFGYLAFLIYYLGYKGFHLSGQPVLAPVHSPTTHTAPNPGLFTSDDDSTKTDDLSEREGSLSLEKQQQLKAAILHAMVKDELFLDPELNLQKLAGRLGVSPSTVSQVINSEFSKSFRNLINAYRIQKVKQMLADPKARQFSILGIALECGFNSEASFYRIFKAAEGISPNEYRKQLDSSV